MIESVLPGHPLGLLADDQRKLRFRLYGDALFERLTRNYDVVAWANDGRGSLEERLRYAGRLPVSEMAAIVQPNGDNFVRYHGREQLHIVERVGVVGHFVVFVRGGGDLIHCIPFYHSIGNLAVREESSIFGHCSYISYL